MATAKRQQRNNLARAARLRPQVKVKTAQKALRTEPTLKPKPLKPAALRAVRKRVPNTARATVVFEPERGTGAKLPLLVMLHGCQQRASDFALGTRMAELAKEFGCVVIFPEQSVASHSLRCWKWYQKQNRRSAHSDASVISEITRAAIERYQIDSSRVYIAGMSAGGAMAGVLAQDFPTLFTAIGVHSGVAPGLAYDVFSAMRLMSRGPIGVRAVQKLAILHAVPKIVFHGDADSTVHLSNGQAIFLAPSAKPTLGVNQQLVAVAPTINGRHGFTVSVNRAPCGASLSELWVIHDAGHAWSGGLENASHTDSRGPDASREMLRFFLQHPISPSSQAIARQMSTS